MPCSHSALPRPWVSSPGPRPGASQRRFLGSEEFPRRLCPGTTELDAAGKGCMTRGRQDPAPPHPGTQAWSHRHMHTHKEASAWCALQGSVP